MSPKGICGLTVKTKNSKLEIKTGILKGIAHPVRIEIVEMLENGEICACDIAGKFTIDRTTVSKHLALMTRLNILGVRRDGQNLYYRLKMNCLMSVLKCIDNAVETGVCDCYDE
jgi:ArsR family transcriptional regulator